MIVCVFFSKKESSIFLFCFTSLISKQNFVLDFFFFVSYSNRSHFKVYYSFFNFSCSLNFYGSQRCYVLIYEIITQHIFCTHKQTHTYIRKRILNRFYFQLYI